MPTENDQIKAKGGLLIGSGELSPAELESGKLKESQIPSILSSAAQFYVNIKDHGGVSTPTETTATIEAAQKFAEEQPGNYGVFYPSGTFTYNSTLKLSVPWLGYPRKSILKRTSSFSYSGFGNQFSILNSHFAASYNSSTADTIHIESVDFEIEGSSEKKSGIGFANVAGGELKDCQIRTNGTNIVNGPLYIYASARNITGNRVVVENLTEASVGGSLFIQNLTSEPASLANATEGIKFVDSIFINTSADEAVAIYGARGMTRRIRLRNCTLEDRTSTAEHQAIFSVFPLSNKGEFTNAAVEDVIAIDCTFIDTTGSCIGDMIRVGATEDAESGKEALCQNIRIINPSIYAKTSKVGNTQSVMRNVVCKFEGPFSGCRVINPYINTKGSSQAWFYAFNGWGSVITPTAIGNFAIGLANCSRVIGGEVEASSRGIYDCGKVSLLQLKLSVETATACYLDNANFSYVSFNDCTVVGGQRLLLTTVGAHIAHVDIKTTEMTPAATNKVIVETPTPAGEAPLKLRIINCTVIGSTTLARSEYIIGSAVQSEIIGNEWFGSPDRTTLLENGRSAEMVAGKITIAAPAVTATGVINITTEGGTAIGASVVERTAGTGFKVEATATSTDRINWMVYS